MGAIPQAYQAPTPNPAATIAKGNLNDPRFIDARVRHLNLELNAEVPQPAFSHSG